MCCKGPFKFIIPREMQYNSHVSKDISLSKRNASNTHDIEGLRIKGKVFSDKMFLREDLQCIQNNKENISLLNYLTQKHIHSVVIYRFIFTCAWGYYGS